MKDHFKAWWPVWFSAGALALVLSVVWFVAGSILPSPLEVVNCFGYCETDEAEVRANLGALGDVVGGLLNPLLAFITIVLLILTIRLTQKTNQIAQDGVNATRDSVNQSVEMLELTKDQVQLSVDEMRLTRDELEGSKNAQLELVATQESQQRAYAFFEHFKAYSDFSVQMKARGSFGVNLKPTTHFFNGLMLIDGEIERDCIVLLFDEKWFWQEWIDKLVVQIILSEGDERLLSIIVSTLTNDLKVFMCLYIYAYDESFDSSEKAGAVMLKVLLDKEFFNLGKLDYRFNGHSPDMTAAMSRAVVSITN
ncbi:MULTISPECIES: hypothetical protein [unclassified Neptuniibacter]|uniref:hypothetical protein n=1 Tax=unclassified Neptuniibacter TaxID=2630693 RepID=UPI000C55752C|nr:MULTISPECIES: hypothetical protein [unclassified Neptuniibacter]MAY42369.1 hypothetical protein [Oceanospirillaceae bacterium]|tara:strand:- start:18719 stop:19645 length:927 start_codon:yes stop_codon:yes gene_type:complete